MGDKFFAYEYRRGEELVLRFRTSKIRALSPSIKAHSRAAIKGGLLVVRGLFDAAVDFMEQWEEDKPERSRNQDKEE